MRTQVRAREVKEMTQYGMVFVDIIKSVCWTKGWGTNGTTEMFPSSENSKELAWLVANGYLFHYERVECDKHRNWRYRYRTAQRYGITSKGWAIAGKYIDCAGIELRYMYDRYPKRPKQ